MTGIGAAYEGSRKPSGVAYLWVGIVLAVVASVPAVFVRGIFGDDFTIYYIFWTEGFSGVARLLRDVAHTGYIVPMGVFLLAGQDTPEVAARIMGLSCHVVNGVLLYRALSSCSQTRAIAALASALFLLSPFYVIRLTQNALYDFFLLFYLLSYVLMNSNVRLLRWLAPLSLFFSLSLETLLALEPLRLMSAYREGEPRKLYLKRLAPFWLTIAVVIALRLTILGKSGHYVGQYSPVSDIGIATAALFAHLGAFSRGLRFAVEYGLQLFGQGVASLLIVGAIAVFALFGPTIFRTTWLLRSRPAYGNAFLLFLFGAAITVLGALPYAATGVYGDVTRGESRLLFPSQFGFLILLAAFIQCVPVVRLRAAVAGGVTAVFALSMAHDTKWLLYDGLVTSDLQRQVRAALLADPEPKLVMLEIPDSPLLFYRNRCLGAHEMNSAQAILRDERRERSFVYTANCGDFTNPDIVPRGRCPISYLDSFPCPPRRETWRYRAAPGIPPLDRIDIPTLTSAVLKRATSESIGLGELTNVTGNQPSPLPRASNSPPCGRPGVRGLLWLLSMPLSSCIEKEDQRD